MWCYFQLEKIEPEPWEVELVKRFDNIALNSFAKSQEKKSSNSSKNKG